MARARTPRARERRRRMSFVAAEAAFVLLALAFAFGAGAVGYVIGRESADENGAPAAEATTEETQATTEAETETGETQTGETETAPTETTETETEGGETETGGEAAAAGQQVFEQAGCGSCHTFAPVGARGAVGPSLDETELSEEEIAEVVTNGRQAMPSFSDRLSEEEIAAVAAFVANPPRE